MGTSNNCMNLAGLVRHGACKTTAAPACTCRLRQRYTPVTEHLAL